MINFTGKNVLIFGLGKFGGGVGVTKYLTTRGAKIRVVDEAPPEKLQESINRIDNPTTSYHFGPPTTNQLEGIDLVVVNSAIPPHHPFLIEIEKKDIPQTTEVNIFFEQCKGKIIGVIGTNGKETVVKLVEAILKRSNAKVFIGGNIGKSLLEDVEKIAPSDWVVFELSSFQLYRLSWIKKRPKIIVYTNIQPDHLEWHGALKAYIAAKFAALVGQGSAGVAIFNIDDPYLREGMAKAEGRVVTVSQARSDADIRIKNNNIIAREGEKEINLSPAELKIIGKHNLLNAMLAAAVGYIVGAKKEAISPALTQFPGVEHALEFVAEINGLTFINDSAAANPDATMAALNSFTKPIWLIAGGYDKKIDLNDLSQMIAEKVEGIATIGQLTNPLADLVDRQNPAIKLLRAGDLQTAFKWCATQAEKESIVLLSPASSSYDQFTNLEQRGDIFKDLVAKFGNEGEKK